MVSNFVFSQRYGNKQYYLVDSLEVKNIKKSELNLVDSCLTIYHKTTDFEDKINILNYLITESYSNEVWPKYNTLMLSLVTKKLKNNHSTEINKFCLNIKSSAINNLGYLDQMEGRITPAITNYTESYLIYTQLNDSMGMANALNNIGSVYYYEGDVFNCLLNYKQSLLIRRNINDVSGIANSLNNIGIIFNEQGDLTEALKYYQESLVIRKTLNNVVLVATQLNNIGLCYLEMNEYLRALSYFKEANAIYRMQNDGQGKGVTLLNIGRCYQHSKKYSEAFSAFRKSLIIFKSSGLKKETGGSLIALSDIYFETGEIKKALDGYQEALDLNISINFSDGICTCYEGLSNCYFRLNQPTKALDCANKSLFIAQDLGYPDLIKNSALSLSNIMEESGDYKRALEFHQLYKRMSDSIVNEAAKISFEIQQAKFQFSQELEIEKKIHDTELKVLNEKAILQKRNMYILIGGLLLIIILVVILIRRLNLNYKQKKIIEYSNYEKSVLLKEVHHRVKNSLQITTSLVRLQKMKLKDESAINALEDTGTRIAAIALVHKSLYQNKDINSVSLKPYIEELVDANLSLTGVRFDLNSPDVLINVDIATPLALVLSELITNSLKHAFKSKSNENQIKIDIKLKSDKQILMLLSDNGIGLPSNFNMNDEDNGLGFEIVIALCEQINAEIIVLEAQKGTCFQIKFDLD
jgi:two-component sensor histidine kinase